MACRGSRVLRWEVNIKGKLCSSEVTYSVRSNRDIYIALSQTNQKIFWFYTLIDANPFPRSIPHSVSVHMPMSFHSAPPVIPDFPATCSSESVPAKSIILSSMTAELKASHNLNRGGRYLCVSVGGTNEVITGTIVKMVW